MRRWSTAWSVGSSRPRRWMRSSTWFISFPLLPGDHPARHRACPPSRQIHRMAPGPAGDDDGDILRPPGDGNALHVVLVIEPARPQVAPSVRTIHAADLDLWEGLAGL